jgi:hypothetical protein
MLVWVGMLYLYPEAAAFLIPAHAVCWAIAIFFFKLRLSWLTSGITALAACGLLLPVFHSNLVFLIGQGQGSFSGFNWWTYFQAFFFGRDSLNPDPFSNAADFVSGALGIYFVTPDREMNAFMAAAVRTLTFLGAAILIFRAAKAARTMPAPPWTLLASSAGISLLIVLGFCVLGQYWTAGKAFSFIAYLVLLLLVGSAFGTGLSDRTWLNRAGLIAASLFLVLQLGFLVSRPVAARQRFAIHYPPPYPALMNVEAKTTINFADWSFLAMLQSHDRVAVHIEDPFIQSFVRMLLISHHIQFCLEPPAFDRSSRSSIIPTGDCPRATAHLVVAKSTNAAFRVRLALMRP